MFKTRLFALAFTLIAACLATTAEARRTGGMAMLEIMEFVAVADNGLALCHLIERHSMVTVPIYYVSKGYVLAPDNCATESYYVMTAGKLAALKAAGIVPATVPDVAQLTLKQQMTFYFWGGLVAVIAGFFLLQKYVNRPSSYQGAPIPNERMPGRASVVFDDYATPTMADHHALLMVEVMCHIAHRDWQIDEAEVKQIVAIARRFLHSGFDDARIRRMIDSARKDLTPRQFQEMSQELSAAQRADVMRAALLIAGAEQQIEPSAQPLIRVLAGVLAVTQADQDRMTTELARAT